MKGGRTRVIGLMGGIGAGKSTVAEMLRELGASVHDADRAAHEALSEAEAKAAAVRLLGPGILGTDGEVDRARVAARVFEDPDALKGLEDILHPRVRHRMEAWMEKGIAQGAQALVLDVPLLAEAGLDARCDLLVFVDAPEAVRAERLANGRGWLPEEAAPRQSRQGDLAAKRARAHAVLSNAGGLPETRRQVQEFWHRHITGGQR